MWEIFKKRNVSKCVEANKRRLQREIRVDFFVSKQISKERTLDDRTDRKSKSDIDPTDDECHG